MRASQLRLEDSFVERINFETDSKFRQESSDRPDWPSLFTQWNLGAEITRLKKKDQDGAPYAIKLKVLMGHNLQEGVVSPYRFSIEMIGIFSFDESVPDDRRANLLEVNGPAVLYGSIREIIHAMTARSRYSALLLPTVTFMPSENPSNKAD